MTEPEQPVVAQPLRAAATELANEAARTVTEPRRFWVNEEGRQQALGRATAAVRLALTPRLTTNGELKDDWVEAALALTRLADDVLDRGAPHDFGLPLLTAILADENAATSLRAALAVEAVRSDPETVTDVHSYALGFADAQAKATSDARDLDYEQRVADGGRLLAHKALTGAPARDEPLKWWVLADVLHEQNESIADIAPCNHRESPPECLGAAQRLATAYNERVRGAPARDEPGIDPERLAEAMNEAFTVDDQERFVDDSAFWQDYAPRVAAAYRVTPLAERPE